jgi:hypothetical protein
MPPRQRNLSNLRRSEENRGEENLPPPPPPPPHYDGMHPAMVQFMAETTRLFAEVVARLPQQRENLGCSMRDFSSHQFRLFDGAQGAMVAEAWITDIQDLFENLGCTDEQKVRYAALKLTGEATKWWKSKKLMLLAELECEALITWEIFKAEFNKRFFPRAQQQLRAIEFQNLVQGSMTVEQYSAKFMELSRFALNLVPDEETKAERFQNGLNPRIKGKVICHKIKDFTELVDVASLAERSLNDAVAAFAHKKRPMPQASYPFKRPAVGGSSGSAIKKNFFGSSRKPKISMY